MRHQAFDALKGRIRKRTSEHRAAECKHEAFDQQLTHEHPPCRAEGCANRHLFLARGRTCEQHVGDVGARDEQQHGDRREQRVERGAELPHEAIDPADHVNGETRRVVVGVRFRDTPCDEIHLRRGARERHAFLELRLEHGEAALLRGIGTVQLHGLPEIRPLLGEPRRHHTDACRRCAIEDERPSDDAGIPVVVRNPHLVRHHEHGWGAGSDVGISDAAAKLRRHAEKPKRVRRHQPCRELLRAVFCRQQCVFEPAADDVFEHMTLLNVVEEFCRLKGGAAASLAAVPIADLHVRNAIDVRVRRRVEQHVLNDTENGRGAADAKRERQDRNDREAGPCDQAAKAIAHVLPDVLQHPTILDERNTPRVDLGCGEG